MEVWSGSLSPLPRFGAHNQSFSSGGYRVRARAHASCSVVERRVAWPKDAKVKTVWNLEHTFAIWHWLATWTEQKTQKQMPNLKYLDGQPGLLRWTLHHAHRCSFPRHVGEWNVALRSLFSDNFYCESSLDLSFAKSFVSARSCSLMQTQRRNAFL